MFFQRFIANFYFSQIFLLQSHFFKLFFSVLNIATFPAYKQTAENWHAVWNGTQSVSHNGLLKGNPGAAHSLEQNLDGWW